MWIRFKIWVDETAIGRFAITAGVSVGATQLILFVLLSWFHLEAWLAAVVATVSTSVPMYFVHRDWVWKQPGALGDVQSLGTFTGISIIGLFGAAVGAQVASWLSGDLTVAIQVGAFVGAAGAGVLRYVVLRFWLFKKQDPDT